MKELDPRIDPTLVADRPCDRCDGPIARCDLDVSDLLPSWHLMPTEIVNGNAVDYERVCDHCLAPLTDEEQAEADAEFAIEAALNV